MNQYQPELGQLVFGQPSQQFAVPEIMTAVLEKLATEYERVGWNSLVERLDQSHDQKVNTNGIDKCD